LFGAGGDSNVVVQISGPSGKELMVNAIGTYSGITLYPYAKPGRYRLAIQAPSTWKAAVQSWSSRLAGGLITGTFKERGDYVYMGTLKRAAEPVITASCSCEGNFVVLLRDFKGGSELLVNEIGKYRGQVLGPSLSAGYYLLEVRADGPWTVRIAR
jgi:hypothetical protein